MPRDHIQYNFTSLSTAPVNWTTPPADDANFSNAIGNFANVAGDFTASMTLNFNTGITIARLEVGDSTGAFEAVEIVVEHAHTD